MTDALARCRREQADAAEVWRATGDTGAWMAVCDWLMEEVILMEAGMDDRQREADYERGLMDGYNRGTRLMRWASVAVGAGWGIAIWYLIELAGRAWR